MSSLWCGLEGEEGKSVSEEAVGGIQPGVAGGLDKGGDSGDGEEQTAAIRLLMSGSPQTRFPGHHTAWTKLATGLMRLDVLWALQIFLVQKLLVPLQLTLVDAANFSW